MSIFHQRSDNFSLTFGMIMPTKYTGEKAMSMMRRAMRTAKRIEAAKKLRPAMIIISAPRRPEIIMASGFVFGIWTGLLVENVVDAGL